MSWSYRITILYLGFMGIIITLVIICSRQNVELVSKDYYQQELKYQDRLEAIANTNALSKTIEHQVKDNTIEISIPSEQVTDKIQGTIFFFCPADSKKDISVAMNFDGNGRQSILKKKLNKGSYKMRFDWKQNGKSFYKEEVITIK
jgi:hypothetical protein